MAMHPAVTVLERAAADLRRVLDSPDGNVIDQETNTRMLKSVEAFGFALADVLSALTLHRSGVRWSADSTPKYAEQLAAKAKALAIAARDA
jgi:hypothetical protein